MVAKNVKKVDSKHKFAKYALPAVVLVLFAGIGIKLLSSSSAATPGYHQILDYHARSQTSGVTDIQAIVETLGTQTVSSVAPGAALDYQVGGKVAVQSQCFYYNIMPNKGGGTTAKIKFVGQGNSVTINLTYDATSAGYMRRTCVQSNTKTQEANSVVNLSPAGGPNVLVFQNDITY